jgi:uncharacterized protein YbjT (DUF2867 family)
MMPNRILITGGTGTLGRVVARRLIDSGAQVRILSRGRRSPGAAGPAGQAEYVVGDVKTGEGLAEALAEVDAVVHCTEPAQHVVDAALRAERPHLVYISIVGVDRIPLGLYRRKLAEEELISTSGLSWTVLRATQFHDLVAVMLRALAAMGKRRPIVPVTLPGLVARGYRAGGNRAPDRAVGTVTFDRYLEEQLAAGTVPYAGALRSYLRFPRFKRIR